MKIFTVAPCGSVWGCDTRHVRIGEKTYCLRGLLCDPLWIAQKKAEAAHRVKEWDYLAHIEQMTRLPHIPVQCGVVHIPGPGPDCLGRRILQADGSTVCDTCHKRCLPPGELS